MADETTKEIGKIIRQYRKNSGLSQAALAKKAGIQPNTLARLERGKHRASSPTIQKLANALNLKDKDIRRLVGI